MPRVKIRDIEVYYEVQGRGPKLLYIGGTGGDLRDKPNIFNSPLPEHFTVLAHDQRGLGQTSKPDKPYTMADYADDAYELVKSVGWSRSHVMGVSFGGMVAQEYALRHPDAVDRLVLACTSSGGAGGASYPIHTLPTDPEEQAKMWLSLLDNRRGESWGKSNPEKYRAALRQMMAPSRFVDEPGHRVGARRQLEARSHHDTYSRLPVLDMPVYICGGRYDALSPPRNLDALHGQIRGSVLELFEGGHLFLGQDPDAFLRVISFLSGDK
jgi:3-oxoadipate enol-lactonase